MLVFSAERSEGAFFTPRRSRFIVYLVLAPFDFPKKVVNPMTDKPKKEWIGGLSS